MGKNRKFKNSYMITVEGVTTNGFQAELFDNVITAVGQAIGVNSQQCRVTMKVLDTEGDFNAETKQMKVEAK